MSTFSENERLKIALTILDLAWASEGADAAQLAKRFLTVTIQASPDVCTQTRTPLHKGNTQTQMYRSNTTWQSCRGGAGQKTEARK